MATRWSFNRLRDSDKIETEIIIWRGPYSWPGFENENGLHSLPNIEGVYLFTFKYKDGFLIYGVGKTNSTRRRIAEHTRDYFDGNKNVLDYSAEHEVRDEIWHGWKVAAANREDFENNRNIYSQVD
jgi:hypothetical protein